MSEIKTFEVRLFESRRIICQIIPMGRDYTVAVYGGDISHVGSVVLAQGRPSLTGEGISSTSSVMNCIGHKDEVVARMFAEAIASQNNCTVVCSCGIHVDDITVEQLSQVKEACKALLDRCLLEMKV